MNQEIFDTEFIKICASIIKSEADNYDYVVNKAQLLIFIEMYELMKKLAEKCGGKLDDLEFKENQTSGCISGTFELFDLYGSDSQNFCRLLSYASAFGVEPKLDGSILVELTIPNVFIRKKKYI